MAELERMKKRGEGFSKDLNADSSVDESSVEQSVEQVDRPLQKKALKKLPIYLPGTLRFTEEMKCTICMNTFGKAIKSQPTKGAIRELKCAHLFHAYCIEKWFRKSSRCPLCNKDQH